MISQDSRTGVRMKYLRGLPHWLLLLGVGWYSQYDMRYVVSIASLGIAFWLWVVYGRNSWGHSVSFDGDTLMVHRKEQEPRQIEGDSITAFTVKADCIALAWGENGRRKSIVFGGEAFREETYARLLQAFIQFVPKSVQEQE